MPLVHTSVEIAAPPAAVRAKFLDFANMNQWHTAFFKSITTVPEGQELKPGTKIHIIMVNRTADNEIVENTPEAFSWRYSGGGMTAVHTWRFKKGKTGPSSTTLIQDDTFTGFMSFLMGEGTVGKMVGERAKLDAFSNQFNKDLKAACEQGAQG